MRSAGFSVFVLVFFLSINSMALALNLERTKKVSLGLALASSLTSAALSFYDVEEVPKHPEMTRRYLIAEGILSGSTAAVLMAAFIIHNKVEEIEKISDAILFFVPGLALSMVATIPAGMAFKNNESDGFAVAALIAALSTVTFQTFSTAIRVYQYRLFKLPMS